MIRPAELSRYLLLDPPADYSIEQAIDHVFRLDLGGFVFNGVVVRRAPDDTMQTLADRYNESFAKRHPPKKRLPAVH